MPRKKRKPTGKGGNKLKIGLIRHYRVLKALPRRALVTGEELRRWFEEYDEADIEPGNAALDDSSWARCFSSDMPRAAKTAGHLYRGEIRYLPELREIPAPAFRSGLKLPVPLWFALLRTAGWHNRKSRGDIREAKRRVERIVDLALAEPQQDTLIVSHAAVMFYLRKELVRRGFRGPSFQIAKNGKLYVFEKKTETEET